MFTFVSGTQSKICQWQSYKVYTTRKDKIIRQIIKILAVILLTIMITIDFGVFELSASAASCSFTPNQVANVFIKKALLREGDRLENAAYGMGELNDMKEILDLLKDPSSKPEFCQTWKDHLYNSIWKISDLSQTLEFNLILALGVSPTGERYNAPGGRGNKETFQKINNIGNNATFVTQKKFKETQVEEAYEWVLQNL